MTSETTSSEPGPVLSDIPLFAQVSVESAPQPANAARPTSRPDVEPPFGVYRPDQSVVVQFGDGRREKMPPVADSDEELIEAIRFLGQNSVPSRPFDDTHPTMTLGRSRIWSD